MSSNPVHWVLTLISNNLGCRLVNDCSNMMNKHDTNYRIMISMWGEEMKYYNDNTYLESFKGVIHGGNYPLQNNTNKGQIS